MCARINVPQSRHYKSRKISFFYVTIRTTTVAGLGAAAAHPSIIAIHLPVLAFYSIPIPYGWMLEFVSS